MPVPKLTFFCELDTHALNKLIDDRVIADLKALNARISLGLPDLSQQRADTVQRLNQAKIPLDAWLLLPREEGYWINLRNSPQAFQRYFEFKDWTEKNGLQWESVALDIEPRYSELEDFKHRNWRLLPNYFLRLFARFEWKRGSTAYRRLVDQIHRDGYRVESYQLPLIEDERKARSSMLQRVAGLIDLPVDREVWMLYSSFVRPNGAGLIASYGDEAQAIAVGSTGGGVEQEISGAHPLSWEEVERDLRLAWYWCNDLYVFSLEGCVEQGFLERLKTLTWDYPVILPEASLARVDGWRRSFQSLLWFLSHLIYLFGTAVSGFLVYKILRGILRRRDSARA